VRGYALTRPALSSSLTVNAMTTTKLCVGTIVHSENNIYIVVKIQMSQTFEKIEII
jgi:hypothetical protein